MMTTHYDTCICGGGCFWGVQALFDKTPGVVETTVGYCGGHTTNPTYKDVCTGTTDHAEVVKIVFDPDKISYTDLLTLFFNNHNPTTKNQQGVDVGTQYRSVIFYNDHYQKKMAETMIHELTALHRFNKPIVTDVVAAQPFYPAEEYHQKYFQKNGQTHCNI